MKMEFDDTDKKEIEYLNDKIRINEDIPLFLDKAGTMFYLGFECRDVVKANVFIGYFMNPKNTFEELGIKCTSVSFRDQEELNKVRSVLQDALNKVDEIIDNK